MPVKWQATFLALGLTAGACGVVAPEREKTAAPAEVTTPAPPARDAEREEQRNPWRPLEKDGLHDTDNPMLALLQQPGEALSVLPRVPRYVDGNNVDWVAALREGFIEPRTNIFPETKIEVLDLDILMGKTAGMPIVTFPHKQHTEWLDCSNCHENIFKSKRGANPVNMLAILQGDFCGQCHGAVAFPLTQCFRCHNVRRANAAEGAAP